MQRGQQFPSPQPTPSAVVPTKPKNTSTEPELPGWQKAVDTGLNVLTAAELALGLGAALFSGGTGAVPAVAGATATQGLKFGAKRAAKAALKAGSKQGTKSVATDALAPGGATTRVPTPTAGTKPTAPTPPKEPTFTPPTRTTTTAAKPKEDLFFPASGTTTVKPKTDLFFPGAGKGPKRTTKMTTKKKTEEDPATTPKTKTKEEEKADAAAARRQKNLKRVKKAATAAGAAALLAKGEENSGEKGWKPSGVV